MKLPIAQWITRGKVILLPALMKFGAGGLALLSLLDASSIPIPMDLVLAGYVWGHRGQFWIYVVAASAGSALGGLLPYFLGRAGGELFLLRRMDRARFEKIRLRFEKQEFFAVLVPSMLPPPTPWKAFVFAAGVFEMRVTPFLLAVFCGRLVRWFLLAALVLRFGPGVVGLLGMAIHRHGWVMAGALLLVLIGLGAWAVLRARQKKKPRGTAQTAIPADEIK